jgi:chemotaxis receptor (MCP) glutamine deamidase CheD
VRRVSEGVGTHRRKEKVFDAAKNVHSAPSLVVDTGLLSCGIAACLEDWIGGRGGQ